MGHTVLDEINEGTTGKYSVTLTDEAGATLADVVITAIRATYFSIHSGTIVNGRENQPALDANNFSLTNGLFAWKLAEADVIIVDSPKPPLVTHRLVLVVEWNDADAVPRQTTHVVSLPIRRVDNAPFAPL